MGKSWKGRSHLNTGYPYNPIRVAHLQSFGSKFERDEETMELGKLKVSSIDPSSQVLNS